MFSLFRRFFNEIVQGFSANKCDMVHKILPQLTLKYRNTSEENLIVQSTLGFATLLGITTSNFGPYVTKQRPSTILEVAKFSRV